MARFFVVIVLLVSVTQYVFPAIYTFIKIGFFSRFLADDYCVAAVARDLSLFDSLVYWYSNWHGGYSVVLIDELLPYIAPDKISLVVPFLLWGWIVVSIATLYVIFPETVNRVLRVVLSLILGPIFVLAMLLINPDIAQSIFWWSGMRAYNLPVLFATIYVFVYFFLRKKQIHWFVAFLTGFLIVFLWLALVRFLVQFKLSFL